MRTGLLIAALLVFSVFTGAGEQLDSTQIEQSLDYYNQLIAENPEKKEGHFNRGLYLYNTGKTAWALADFNKCLLLDSLFAEARVMKGLCLEKNGRLKEAVAEYEIVEEQGTNPALLNGRIKNYHVAVLLSKNWYYMIAMMLVVILLMAVVAKSFAYRKG